MLCLLMSSIEIPSCEVERAQVVVLESFLHLREEIWVCAERGLSGEAEEVCESILVRPKGGYL